MRAATSLSKADPPTQQGEKNAIDGFCTFRIYPWFCGYINIWNILPNLYFLFIFYIRDISQGFAGLVTSTSTLNPVFCKGMVKKYPRYNSGRGRQQEKLHKSLQNVLSLLRGADDCTKKERWRKMTKCLRQFKYTHQYINRNCTPPYNLKKAWVLDSERVLLLDKLMN